MIEIKVKTFEGTFLPEIIKKGDWIDLCAAEDYNLNAPYCKSMKFTTENNQKVGKRDIEFNKYLIRLGIAMKLPEGFEAILAPRSSSFNKYGIIQTNSIGIIDNSYCGNNDEWKMPVLSMTNAKICKGDRIAQFRIQLSQKATFKQKLKWLFSSRIKLTLVTELSNSDRDGFGSTGR